MSKIRTKKELLESLKTLDELEKAYRELGDQIDSIKDKIKDYMGESESLVYEGYSIKWTKYLVTRFDSTAFKKDYPNLYESYKISSESRRFSIN